MTDVAIVNAGLMNGTSTAVSVVAADVVLLLHILCGHQYYMDYGCDEY